MTYIPPNPNGQALSANSAPVVIASDQSAIAVQSQGDVAAGVSDSGNPVKIGGIYNTNLPELSNGERGNVQLDTNANLKVREQYAPAYEDNTNGVAKVEQRGTYYYQATASADVVVKPSAGFLYGIIIGKDVAGSVIEVSDHASDGDGNVQIYLEGSTLLTSTGGYVPVNASFFSGITVNLTNQTNVTFVYR